jgi:hypothetical protein
MKNNTPHIITSERLLILAFLACSMSSIEAEEVIGAKENSDSHQETSSNMFLLAGAVIFLLYMHHKFIYENAPNPPKATVDSSATLDTLNASHRSEPNPLHIRHQSTIKYDIRPVKSMDALCALALMYVRDREKEKYGVNRSFINDYSSYLSRVNCEMENIKSEFSKFSEEDIGEMQGLVIDLHWELTQAQLDTQRQSDYRASCNYT